MSVTNAQKEYVFKINLKGMTRISRTIAICGNQTLNDLHEAIFASFDRFDPHLYSFYFPKAPTYRRTSGRKPKEYTSPEMFDDPDPFDDESRFDAAATRLDTLKLRVGQKFEYLFDFGDSWWHEISVEAVNPSLPEARYPQIREKRGKSPPQYEVIDE